MKIETNISPVDLFTIAHFGIGLWAGQFFTPVQVACGMTVWEIAEHPLKDRFPRMFPAGKQDSAINSVIDVLAAYAGAHVVRRLT